MEAFNELKLKHTYRYIIYAMNGAHSGFVVAMLFCDLAWMRAQMPTRPSVC